MLVYFKAFLLMFARIFIGAIIFFVIAACGGCILYLLEPPLDEKNIGLLFEFILIFFSPICIIALIYWDILDNLKHKKKIFLALEELKLEIRRKKYY